MLAAVARGDVDAVRGLLKQKADVNVREADGSTPLLWAVHQTNAGLVMLLIDAGADVNAANRYGITPLVEASRLGSTPIIDSLLKAGANPNVKLPDGETPLMSASGAGNLAAVKLFIARGADVNAREGSQNQTALMWAAEQGRGDIIGALISAGADPSVVAAPSKLPRTISGDAGGRMWTDHASGGLTALMFAARQGHVDAIKALADGHADLNYENPDHITALMLAVLNDHSDAADALLQKGASTNDGALYEAVVLHNLRTNETAGEATRPRPWHDNALAPVDLIAHLLEHGADPNRLATHTIHYDGTGGAGAQGVPTAINESPFARALRAQDVAVIKLMLGKGANPSEPIAGSLPLALAMGAGGGRGFAGGFGVAPAGFRYQGDRAPAAAVSALLAAGADVNAVNDSGETVLHTAAQAGNVPMIRLFAEHGAKLDVQNKAGFTPLDLAMGKGAPAGGRGARGGGGGAPPGRGGGPGGPQPQAIAALRELMGLPPLAPGEMPSAAAGPQRGGGN
jgi:cytohesin